MGAADYIVKPVNPEGLDEIALEAAIKNAIEKTRLVSEINELRWQLSDDQDRAFLFWGDSPEMRTIASMIEQVSDSDVTVLIRGESGVGKELVARAIHQRSPRKERPFVKVNCAALPGELLESELFGHEKGAFTGAATTRIGKFEQADTGTIFLDEVGEMKAALQAKLLHAVQDAQFTKLGSNRPITVDVRLVAATNRDLRTSSSPCGICPVRRDQRHRTRRSPRAAQMGWLRRPTTTPAPRPTTTKPMRPMSEHRSVPHLPAHGSLTWERRPR
jgi:DNA-binding NtrC family response regulator